MNSVPIDMCFKCNIYMLDFKYLVRKKHVNMSIMFVLITCENDNILYTELNKMLLRLILYI